MGGSVGASVGFWVGANVGFCVGWSVGASVGFCVGWSVGASVGFCVDVPDKGSSVDSAFAHISEMASA